MAYDDNQNEYPLPGERPDKRESAEFLPRYFRTEPNRKFLASTIDQLLSPGVAEKLSGYIGRRHARAFKNTDNYIPDFSTNRENYQLEPSVVIKDSLDNVTFFKDYNDYINQLDSFGGSVKDHSRLNAGEYYAWNPNIDWDKFVNYREYFWLPTGPDSVDVFGQTRDIESTYSVSIEENNDNTVYKFSPPGLTQNPSLTLYRGVTYRFDIDTPGFPIAFATSRKLNDNGEFTAIYSDGQTKIEELEDDNTQEVEFVENGYIEFTVPLNAPDVLYYVSSTNIDTSGLIKVYDLVDATFIDVDEIIGKKSYKTEAGFELSNGMKVKFRGTVTPAKYAESEWYVEGVGEKIKFIDQQTLIIPSVYSDDIPVPFDSNEFDKLPFANANSYAGSKDYITINRASKDLNAWTRYNRWFHKSVIEKTAEINNTDLSLDQDTRAKRPIIEFNAGLKLFNFGSESKIDVDLIDTFTRDVFSDIEGSTGYNIDTVDITDGMRILFTADTDIRVKNKIYQVEFITHNNIRQIALRETDDTDPVVGETILVKQGAKNSGKIWHYTGGTWAAGQEKTKVNQQPLFEIYDEEGNPYSDQTVYDGSTFFGNKIFSYKIGTGANDPELGFPLSYRSIQNSGDIVFEFNLLTESMEYQIDNVTETKNTDIGFLRKYDSLDTFTYVNGWSKPKFHSKQSILRQYVVDNNNLDKFKIDVYSKPNTIDNLWLRVYVNNELQKENVDYVRETTALDEVFVRFNNPLLVNDVVLLKTRADADKTSEGYYEIPYNLERNPQNENLSTFTLGEVNDHVDSMIEELNNFEGIYPGPSNLRDLGNLNPFGTKFLKHSHPLNLAIYHTTNTEANLIKAIKYARSEYAKFKRQFLQVAYTLGYDGPVKEHVDRILKEVNKDKTKESPFYFSDMLAYTAAKRTIFEVEDPGNVFFALSQPFLLDTLSSKAVGVYLNGTQLIFGRDYTFNEEGFCIITATKQNGDVIELYQYETSDGCFIPPTPTKLGFYPKYRPEIYIDDTYLEPTKVIQGHDGSITKAYDDFRDDLILELEKRIFNNLKQEYRKDIFDIHKLQKGIFRETGIAKKDIDASMISDFTQWLSVAGNPDYSDNSTWFNSANTFTFNYSFTESPNNKPLKGFWRSVYRQAYDTDRPHTHPWEMLGFTIKPEWWEEQYGPAPYTRDNFVLWEDLQNGVVRQPNAPIKILDEYKRPSLMNHIPVNAAGQLISPLESNLAQGHVPVLARTQFAYGDEAPVETAWRRSSEYPFALLTAFSLNKPAETIGVGFDLSRLYRNLAGQIVYRESQKPIDIKNIVFPNSIQDTSRVLTSGLVNYMSNYLASDITISYQKYKNDLKAINNQLSYKLGGFTEKQKFQLLLDSRSPTNQSNVFVPQENYKIFLNKSSAVQTVNYSGVIVEKAPSGYSVRGYDSLNPVFSYYPAIEKTSDRAITIGGISEPFLDWATGQQYLKGQNIRYENTFYRTINSHRSTNVFDNNNFEIISQLPIQGGATAFIRKNFETEISQLPYGTVLRDLQEVVDFLLGYGVYLDSIGFKFEYYDNDQRAIQNFQQSVKEFLFWTTQNWQDGSILTISPGANRIKFETEYAVVDDLFSTFYPYSILRADANKIDPEFVDVFRDGNKCEISLKNTNSGLYNIRLNLVQTEHVVLLDNTTVFNDVIYDLAPGYRQERIKVVGYRSDNWQGSLSVPGFIYDAAETTEWLPYTDYQLGQIVKYKEFFYSANTVVEGSATFNSKEWVRLSEKPEATLLTNLDYKASQFADFYDLDTDNFDTEQQKLAQHLIGYQKRQYLANIINDDVSQYKFYQGFIQDKGTQNSLSKLFDALASADKESLDFYEEWAIRLGQYGAADGFDEIEYILDESKFKLSPQPVELVQSIPSNTRDDIYRIKPYEVYLAPENYDHSPFPTKASTFTEQIKTAGYVNPDDVDYSFVQKSFITSTGVIPSGEYAWIAQEGDSWTVFKSTSIDNFVTTATVTVDTGNTVELTLAKAVNNAIKPGDIIGILDIENLEGYHVVQSVGANTLILPKPNAFINPVENGNGILTTFDTVRFSNFIELNEYAQKSLENFDIAWIDNDGSDNWSVYKNTKVYDVHNLIENPQGNTDSTRDYFGSAMAVNDNNTILAIGSPDYFAQGAVDDIRISQNSGYDANRTPGTYTDLELFNYTGTGTGARFTVVIDGLGNATISVTNPGVGYTGGEEVSINVTDIGGTGSDLKFFIVTNKGGVVNVYTRGNESGNYRLLQTIAPDTNILADITEPTRFGASVAVSGDGKYLAVGSPNASRVLTRYRGEFDPNIDYEKNQIVSYNESLWQARKQVLGSEDNILYTSFDAYSFIAEQSDSTDIKLLLAGNNRFNGTSIDHLLIRAPKDQYEGTEIGDTIVLKWNNYSVANLANPVTSVEPFLGTYSPAITTSTLTGNHIIQKKIDHVFNVENYTVLPEIGDIIKTATASGKVEYLYNDVATREAVIYLSETNGIFLQTDDIFLDEDVLIGTYAEDNFNNIDVLGGYWLINTTSYLVNSSNSTDTGRGLIFRDVLNLRGDDGDPATPDGRTIPYYYYNIQDNIQEITYVNENDRVSFLTHLSYTGIFDTTIEERPSPWWVVRTPIELSNNLNAGDQFKFYVDTLGSIDLTGTGLSSELLNNTHTIVEEWDGYIDMEFTEFQTVDLEPDGNLGDPIEPTPKYEFDQDGNLITRGPGLYSTVRDLVTGATAEVMFYQRQFNNVRLYVSNVTGNWLSGSRFGETAAIERVGSPSRTMGEVLETSLGSAEVGKLFLISEGVTSTGVGTDLSTGNDFDATTNTLDLEPQQRDIEYWFYEEENILGVPRVPSYPDSRNNEWNQIFNLPASEFGVDSTFTNEGLFSIYEKAPLGEYQLINYFTLPDRGSERKLGYKLKFAKNNNLYSLFVAEEGNETVNNNGKIYIIKKGSDGVFEYDWEIGKDRNYRGEFDNTSDYSAGELVIFNDTLYQAVTNLAAGEFLLSNWTEYSDNISRLGFIPSSASLKLPAESIFDPHSDGLETGILKFARDFSVSSNGGVVAVSASLVGSDSTSNNAIAIYRRINGNYQFVQEIYGEDDISGFGISIDLSDDGNYLAIGENLADDNKINQGKVYIYQLQNQQFTLVQTLSSANNETNEKFGSKVAFDGQVLAVTGLQSDAVNPTTFDIYSQRNINSSSLYNSKYATDRESPLSPARTTIDGNHTIFTTRTEDTGVVYMFENINGSFVYSESLSYQDEDYFYLGENLNLKKNHVYVATPRVTKEDHQGTILEYRKPNGTNAWNVLRQPVPVVNVDKFRGAYIYNIKTNKIIDYIDILDPVQGKIAGPAEAEISYKTLYDPALYNVINEDFQEQNTSAWGENATGKIWWNLRNVRFYNTYQADTIFQTNFWNTIFPGTSIEIYEWTESTYSPSEWDSLSGTAEGEVLGITGTTRYGDRFYTQKQKYDPVAQRFTNVFYYWVRNKRTVPLLEDRNLSADDIRALIENPFQEGYKFAALLSNNKFALYNCNLDVEDKDVAINFSYWTIENQEQNIHTEYQLMTEGLETSLPKTDIETKWFDSLIGYDEYQRPVPDPELSDKQKYGTLFKPRQSWFKNQPEALKQVIDRINSVAKTVVLSDLADFSVLNEKDPLPNINSNLYDNAVDTYADIEFIGTAKVVQAELTPLIVDGEIVQVEITNPGRGYIQPPSYKIVGEGSGADLRIDIDALGKVSNVTVLRGGKNYTESTTIKTRKFSVLVRADENATGRWTINEFDSVEKVWSRITTQAYDVSKFWQYVDWYAPDYNEFSGIDEIIDATYELSSLELDLGSIVKINSVGSGGWLLLEKIADVDTEDYTINYRTIGRENGTIEFLSSLYDAVANRTGFDTTSFDARYYDIQPIIETRKILQTVRDDIFVDELRVEYNKLFFASLRYVFAEQNYVDWAFKTSFVKSKHNVGELEQRLTFNNDNLENYQEYVNEVKPFKTKIREYISGYDKIEPTNSVTTDFDLPASYSSITKQIVPESAKTTTTGITGISEEMQQYPKKHWLDNVGFSVTEVNIAEPGSGFLQEPVISLVGGGGSGATAKAYIGDGKITRIQVLSEGSGYITAPQVVINGSQEDGSVEARASAVLGNTKVRGVHIRSKFDRVSGNFYITNLAQTENFVGTGADLKFTLKWPIDLKSTRTVVSIDGIESLRSQYIVSNVDDNSKSYSRKLGRIEFIDPPASGTDIKIEYFYDINLLNAQDRINFFYDPTTGMIGKDVAQLMDGIDYGGVEVKSLQFDAPAGWDTNEWFASTWDTYDNTFEDEIFRTDSSTLTIELQQPLEVDIVYNIYKNGVRIDDPNFGTGNPITNPNAIVQSITGAGETEIDVSESGLNIPLIDGDVLIVRKTTSDGSFLPDPLAYDTQLTGGDLQYNTAKGINAEEINIDGDGFVTPTTSKGPEELVPGQLVDTLDIRVYHRVGDGASTIYSQNYITDGTTAVYDLGVKPNTNQAVFVRLDKVNLDETAYTLDVTNNTVTFSTVPTAGSELNILTMGISGEQILDIDEFVADGTSIIYELDIPYQTGSTHYVQANRESVDVIVFETENNKFGLNFTIAPVAGTVISYGIFYASGTNYSHVKRDTFYADGSTLAFQLSNIPFNAPPVTHKAIVTVGDKILNPGYNQRFEVTSTREYQLQLFQQPNVSLLPDQIDVYLNGLKLEQTISYRYDIFNTSVVLFSGVGTTGDVLEVFVNDDGEYTFDTETNELIIDTSVAMPIDTKVEVLQFSNHDIQDMTRINYDVVNRTTLSSGTSEYVEYHNLTTGLIKLRGQALDAQYVWVAVNGNQLIPSVDYYVTDDRYYIQIVQTLSENDVIDIVHFRASLLNERFGFRQFKDMLNRTHYKRLNDTYTFELAQDLNWYDLRVEVVDGSNLTEPNKLKNMPGVLFIDGERIEYFVKEGNTLRQLRRGTLGTGVKQVYTAGTRIFDQSAKETIPYKDELISTVLTPDGSTGNFELDFTPSSADDFEVFAGGKRLRKNVIDVFDPTIDQDSPEADVEAEAEFNVTDNILTLNYVPSINEKIIVVRKQGKVWNPTGTSLTEAENDIARFLRDATVDLPE